MFIIKKKFELLVSSLVTAPKSHKCLYVIGYIELVMYRNKMNIILISMKNDIKKMLLIPLLNIILNKKIR